MKTRHKRWLWLAVIAMSMAFGYALGKFVETKLMSDTYTIEAY